MRTSRPRPVRLVEQLCGGSPRCSQMTRTSGSVWLTRTWNQRPGQSTRRPSARSSCRPSVVALQARISSAGMRRAFERYLALQHRVSRISRRESAESGSPRSCIIERIAEHGRDAVVDEPEPRHHYRAGAFSGHRHLLGTVARQRVHRRLPPHRHPHHARRHAAPPPPPTAPWSTDS